jgi:glycine oxidase
MRSADVVVCGAGMVGTAIARELAGRGLRVEVLDRGRPGSESATAAAGLLSPYSTAGAAGPFTDMCIRALGFFPPLARELADETGVDVGFRRCGTLRLPGAGEELAGLLQAADALGSPVERVDAQRADELVGGRLGRPVEALFFPTEGVVENPRLVAALRLSAESRGAVFHAGRPALGLVRAGGVCRGVETADERIGARWVVDAAGAWSGFGVPLPVRPVRGQVVELELPAPGAIATFVRGHFYLATRTPGRLLVGSTVEDAGFDKSVTAGGVAELLERALSEMPVLAGARFARAWAGLRPGTPDGAPILGESAVEGLLLATGTFRNGVLLAPLVGRLLAERIAGVTSDFDWAPFRADRFSHHGSFTAADEH